MNIPEEDERDEGQVQEHKDEVGLPFELQQS